MDNARRRGAGLASDGNFQNRLVDPVNYGLINEAVSLPV
jgi:hypothetical protein